MKITLEFLKKHNACSEGMKFVKENNLIGLESTDFIEKLIELKKLQWANWLTVRVLCKIDNVKYAVYAAEHVIDIFEKEYPDDDRPRKAIKAAKAYIANPRQKTRDAAQSAAQSAAEASWRAWDNMNISVESAAASAAEAAWSTCSNNMRWSAVDAALDADRAVDVAGNRMLKKIINNGIKLLKEKLLCA